MCVYTYICVCTCVHRVFVLFCRDHSNKENIRIDDKFVSHELEGRFLEGTGSMVLDRVNKICYAVISPRTHPLTLNAWAKVDSH